METIEATDYSQKATIVTLDEIPTVTEQNDLLTDDSIVLEF